MLPFIKYRIGLIFVSLAFFMSNIEAQNRNMGIEAGGSLGVGQGYNNLHFFYSEKTPSAPLISGELGFILNPRLAMKLSLTGSSVNSNYLYQGITYQLSNPYIMPLLECYINFFSYGSTVLLSRFTPYLSYGIGGIFTSPDQRLKSISNANTDMVSSAVIIFGTGIQYRFLRKFSIFAQWKLGIAFTDRLDGVPSSQLNQTESSLLQSDWVNSFAVGLRVLLFQPNICYCE